MRQFAARFPDIAILPQAVAQLPWGHIFILIHKIKDNKQLLWYAEQTIEQGWTRITLENQIKDNLFKRQAIGGRVGTGSNRRICSYITYCLGSHSFH